MDVDVAVDVDVDAPGSVAALVNWNDHVALIAPRSRESRVAQGVMGEDGA